MERRFAAILALDMVGYSRLIEADEADTLARLSSIRSDIISPSIERHGGRIIKGTGDGVLAEFDDVTSAIDSAFEIQGAVIRDQEQVPAASRIMFRVGINAGDICAEDGDVYGHGVNVAARIESLADPGGILISGSVYNRLEDRASHIFEDLGPHLVKNIRSPIRVYRVLPKLSGHGFRGFLRRLRKRQIVQWGIAYFAGAWILLEMFDLVAEQFLMPVWIRQGATVLLLFGVLITLVLAWYHGERGRQKVGLFEAVLLIVLLALAGQSIWMLKYRSDQLTPGVETAEFRFREQPLPQHSVAVLPCRNLGDDEGQGYFADGLAAELITRLAAVRGLRIPSQTSSFSFRGQNVTLEVVAASLKVRHVLECDIFGDASRVRIGARLIDAESGYTLWSESFNRAKSTLFDVQEEVARAVVRNLEIHLVGKENLLVGRHGTDSVEAYDEFLRGIENQDGFPTPEALEASYKHLMRAVELDPQFGRAYARLALHWVIMGNFGYAPSVQAYSETERLARRALEIDGDLSEAHWSLGWAQFGGQKLWKEAEASFRKVIELTPGNWEGYHSLGFLQGTLGRYDEAMKAARIATDLNPLAYWPRRGMEILHTRQRQWDKSVDVTMDLGKRLGWSSFMLGHMARTLALAGRDQEARDYLLRLEESNTEDVNALLYLSMVYSEFGEYDKARSLAEPWRQIYEEDSDRVLPGTLAFAYASLGDTEQALRFLMEARDSQDIELLFLDDPCFDSMRGDPRFVELIRSLDLPEDIYLAQYEEKTDQEI